MTDYGDIITIFGERRPSAPSLPQDTANLRPEHIHTENDRVATDSNDDLSPEKQRRTISTGMLAIGYVTAAVAILTGVLSALAFHSIHNRLAQWPHVQASIDSCENYHVLVEHGGSEPYARFEYGFRCKVTYTPQALVHHSLIDIGYRSSDPNEMAAWSKSVHRGVQIPVIYDPNDFTRVQFATDFRTAYAGAIHNLHFVILMTVVSIASIVFGRLLRLSLPNS